MIRNFVVENANAPGTNLNVLLAGANQGYQTWRQAYPTDGSLVFYFIDDGGAAEWGVGTLHTASNPVTLSRDTVIGNTGGRTGRVNFVGAVQVYNEIPGERMPFIHTGILRAPGATLDTHSGGVPIGASMDYWGTVSPAGWLFCDGRSISRTTYAMLFAVIGTTYGALDASSFLLPDTQANLTYGKSQPEPPASSGASGLNRLGPWQNTPLGGVIGDWRLDTHNHGLNWFDPGHAHAVADPSHVHGVGDPGHAHAVADPGHNHALVDPGHVHAYRHSSIISASGFAAGANFNITDQFLNTDDGAVRGTGMSMNAAGTGIEIFLAGTGVSLGAAVTHVSIFSANTGISASVQPAGSGIGFQNVSPGIVCNKIIYAGPVP